MLKIHASSEDQNSTISELYPVLHILIYIKVMVLNDCPFRCFSKAHYINLKMYDLYGHWDDPLLARHHSALEGPTGFNNIVRTLSMSFRLSKDQGSNI